VNLCIPKYHKYSYFFDQPVYFANEFLYFEFQFWELSALLIYYLAYYFAAGPQLWDQPFYMLWLNMIYILASQGRYLHLSMALVTGWLIVVKIFYFVVLVWAIVKNYTLDELWNPQYYPYLFKQAPNIENRYYFKNDANLGVASNIKAFLAQAISSRPLLN
jgi:hypothetical protein